MLIDGVMRTRRTAPPQHSAPSTAPYKSMRLKLRMGDNEKHNRNLEKAEITDNESTYGKSKGKSGTETEL